MSNNYFDFSEFAFNPDEYEERSFEPLPAGNYRMRIDNVDQKMSKSGNPYWQIELAVSGDNRKIWHTITYMKDNMKMTGEKLKAFFAAFGITNYDLNQWQKWAGHTGGARTKIVPAQNGYEAKADIHYFLKPEETAKLPAWQEPSNGLMAGVPAGGFQPDASNVPW